VVIEMLLGGAEVRRAEEVEWESTGRRRRRRRVVRR